MLNKKQTHTHTYKLLSNVSSHSFGRRVRGKKCQPVRQETLVYLLFQSQPPASVCSVRVARPSLEEGRTHVQNGNTHAFGLSFHRRHGLGSLMIVSKKEAGVGLLSLSRNDPLQITFPCLMCKQHFHTKAYTHNTLLLVREKTLIP